MLNPLATGVLKSYPSGFLGSTTVAQTKPVDLVTQANQLFNKAALSTTVNWYTANQEVLDLWGDTSSGSPEYKTFEFKERILRCALSAFGTTTLFEWVQLQLSSPYYTQNHASWIDETMLFVFSGKNRHVSANNWRALIGVDHTSTSKLKLSQTIRHLFLGERAPDGLSQMGNLREVTIREFIHQWVQRPGGIADLVASLNVLFGKR